MWVTLFGIQVTDSVSGLGHFLIKVKFGCFLYLFLKNNIVMVCTINIITLHVIINYMIIIIESLQVVLHRLRH